MYFKESVYTNCLDYDKDDLKSLLFDNKNYINVSLKSSKKFTNIVTNVYSELTKDI